MFRRTDRHTDRVHTHGFEVAVGVIAADEVSVARPEPLGLDCPTCDERGRIDMVDAPACRAYLSCRSCGRSWNTDRAVVTV